MDSRVVRKWKVKSHYYFNLTMSNGFINGPILKKKTNAFTASVLTIIQLFENYP